MRIIVIAIAAVLSASAPPAAGGVSSYGDYVQPVRGPVIRHFEPPPTPYAAGHRGIDIAAPVGSIVVASSDGVVRFAGAVGGSLFVSVEHPDGTRTTYSFLSAVLVRAGASVRQGDAIARSGGGHPGVEPAHLHFGALVSGEYVDAEQLLVRSLRRNLWRAVHLAPDDG